MTLIDVDTYMHVDDLVVDPRLVLLQYLEQRRHVLTGGEELQIGLDERQERHCSGAAGHQDLQDHQGCHTDKDYISLDKSDIINLLVLITIFYTLEGAADQVHEAQQQSDNHSVVTCKKHRRKKKV